MNNKFYKEQPNSHEFFVDAARRIIRWNAIQMNCSVENEEAFMEKFTQQKFELQIRLVEEELKEYRDAWKDNNDTEIMDAIADSFVVSTFLSYMFFGKQIIETFLNSSVGDHLCSDPYETFMKSREVFTEATHVGFLAASTMRQCRDSLIKAHYDGKAVLTEVLRSNDSKFATEEQLLKAHKEAKNLEEAIKAELVWLEENRTEYSGFAYRYNEEEKVYVFLDGNQKVMKPSTFSKANVKQFVSAK